MKQDIELYKICSDQDIVVLRQKMEYVLLEAEKYNSSDIYSQELIDGHLFDWFPSVYTHNAEELKANFPLYMSDNVQDNIKKHHLDSEKLWFLLAYINLMVGASHGKHFEGEQLSLGQHIDGAVKLLTERMLSTSIIISSGDTSFKIYDPDIKVLIKELLERESRLRLYLYNQYHAFLGKEGTNWQKATIAVDMLDYFFAKINMKDSTPRRDWKFYAQLLYILCYITEKRYLTGKMIVDLGFKRQEVAFDIGRAIRDSIKFCNKETDFTQSTLYFQDFPGL